MTSPTGTKYDDIWIKNWEERTGRTWPNMPQQTPLMDHAQDNLEKIFAGEIFEDLRDNEPDRRLVINLPPEVLEYKNDLRRFIDAMVYKLRKNAHKGRWEGMRIEQAMKLLHGEVDELEGAILEKNTFEICTEAADVANFALILSAMAIDNGE